MSAGLYVRVCARVCARVCGRSRAYVRTRVDGCVCVWQHCRRLLADVTTGDGPHSRLEIHSASPEWPDLGPPPAAADLASAPVVGTAERSATGEAEPEEASARAETVASCRLEPALIAPADETALAIGKPLLVATAVWDNPRWFRQHVQIFYRGASRANRAAWEVDAFVYGRGDSAALQLRRTGARAEHAPLRRADAPAACVGTSELISTRWWREGWHSVYVAYFNATHQLGPTAVRHVYAHAPRALTIARPSPLEVRTCVRACVAPNPSRRSYARRTCAPGARRVLCPAVCNAG